MAERMTPERTTPKSEGRQIPVAVPMDEPLPTANDPGGADSKGYSADPRPERGGADKDPIPLAPAPDAQPAIHQPEFERKVQPTGRKDETYTPNDRLMGSDR
jgi:hypothetical protein